MHGGWHHLVFWKTFPTENHQKTKIFGITKIQIHVSFRATMLPIILSSTTVSTTLFGAKCLPNKKKFQELRWSWTTGWLPMNCEKWFEKPYPFVACFFYYLYKSNTIHSQIYRTSTTNSDADYPHSKYFLSQHNQHYNCTLSGKIPSLNIHVPMKSEVTISIYKLRGMLSISDFGIYPLVYYKNHASSTVSSATLPTRV